MELDELDRRILQELQTDASLTNHALAQRVHASAPTCLRRVKKLTEDGVIERQVALVKPECLGMGLGAIVEITLEQQNEESFTAFEDVLLTEPAISQCYRVSPGPDFVLMVQVRDMAAYHELAHRVFTAHKNVRNVRSYFTVRRVKYDTRIPA